MNPLYPTLVYFAIGFVVTLVLVYIAAKNKKNADGMGFALVMLLWPIILLIGLCVSLENLFEYIAKAIYNSVNKKEA